MLPRTIGGVCTEVRGKTLEEYPVGALFKYEVEGGTGALVPNGVAVVTLTID